MAKPVWAEGATKAHAALVGSREADLGQDFRGWGVAEGGQLGMGTARAGAGLCKARVEAGPHERTASSKSQQTAESLKH